MYLYLNINKALHICENISVAKIQVNIIQRYIIIYGMYIDGKVT